MYTPVAPGCLMCYPIALGCSMRLKVALHRRLQHPASLLAELDLLAQQHPQSQLSALSLANVDDDAAAAFVNVDHHVSKQTGLAPFTSKREDIWRTRCVRKEIGDENEMRIAGIKQHTQ
jgi:hypothetical protein